MATFKTITAATFFLTLGLLAGVLKSLFARPASTILKSAPEIVFVQTPEVVSGELTKRFPRGSQLVRLALRKSSGHPVDLTPGFFAAADPQASFDASRLLFSGQEKEGEPWQIWEMAADGSGKRQLTHCACDCLRPAYLPRNEIVYTAVSRKGGEQTSELYVSKRDGSQAHPITFGPGNFQVETVLRDGRLLVSAESMLIAGAGVEDSRTLYILRTDGTGLTPFRQDLRESLIRTGAEELPDGTVLFVRRNDRSGREAGGTLAWIPPGTLHNSVLTPPESTYWSAHELNGKTLIVAKRNSTSAVAGSKFDLYAFDVQSKTLGALLYRNTKLSSVQAVPLAPRAEPKYYWSILHPTRKTGRVICLNSYLSSDAPHGRLDTPIARVRVIELQADHHQERVLGDARVEKDGSFYLDVPADQPIRFELLNAEGGVIRAQRSWVWARTGEDVGCLGCHEDKAQAPPNHWPIALERFDTPIPVGVPAIREAKKH